MLFAVFEDVWQDVVICDRGGEAVCCVVCVRYCGYVLCAVGELVCLDVVCCG